MRSQVPGPGFLFCSQWVPVTQAACVRGGGHAGDLPEDLAAADPGNVPDGVGVTRALAWRETRVCEAWGWGGDVGRVHLAPPMVRGARW